MVNWDVLVDYALRDPDALENLKRPNITLSDAFVTDYVISRAVDTLASKGKAEEANLLVSVLYGSIQDNSLLTHSLRTVPVGGRIEVARRLFLKHCLQAPLGLTDWTTIAVMADEEIDGIITKDTNFDKLGLLSDVTLPKITRVYEVSRARVEAGAVRPPRNKLALAVGLGFLLIFFAVIFFLPNTSYNVLIALLAVAAFFILIFVEPRIAQPLLEFFIRKKAED